MTQRPFPTDYDVQPSYFVPINATLLPLIAGALRFYERHDTWLTDADYAAAYNAFAELQIAMFNFQDAAAGEVLIGPESGAAATPTLRRLVVQDLPVLTFALLTDLPTTLGGYGITDAFVQAAADARYRPIGYVPAAGDIPNPLNAIGIRTAIGANAAGLFVPWITGDTQPAFVAGSPAAGNDQVGVYGKSNTGIGVRGDCSSANAYGVYAQSGGIALVARRSANQSSTIDIILRLQNATGATPVPGFGAAINIQIKSSTTGDQDAAQIAALWTTATHASRTSALALSTVSNAGALVERARVDAGAGANTTGFLLWDVDSGAMKRVEVGAADSGGTGYRMLRVAN